MLSGVAALLAMPFAVWRLIGDQSETSLRPHDQLDYAWRAPAISGTLTAIVGAIALVMVTVGIVAYVVAAKRHLLDRRWLLVLAAFLTAGAWLALIGRVVTAGVIGANIGGGIAVLFGLPIVACLIVYATVRAILLVVSEHRPNAAP